MHSTALSLRSLPHAHSRWYNVSYARADSDNSLRRLFTCNSWWLLCSFVVLHSHEYVAMILFRTARVLTLRANAGRRLSSCLVPSKSSKVCPGVKIVYAARVRWPVWFHFRLGDGNHAGGGKICLAFLFVFNMPFIDYTFFALPLATYGDFTPIGHSWVKAIRPKSQSRRGWVGAPKDFLACEFACCYVSG